MGLVLYFIVIFSVFRLKSRLNLSITAGTWAHTLSASRQFYVVNDTKLNWTEAHNHCRINYTDLATIENKHEMNTVRALLQGMSNQPQNNFWIGLKQNSTSPHNNESWVWSDGSPFDYRNWKPKEPNNTGNDNCVELYAENNYEWNDSNCSNNVNFICQSRIPLVLINETKTWREARWYCRQHFVDLVSVCSPEMQQWVAYVVGNYSHSSSNVWIGLRHTRALGFWYWVTGEMICYHQWAEGFGTEVEHCDDVERTGAMDFNSKEWISLPETEQLPFVCSTT